MARERSEMRRVKEVLRLRLAFGLSHKAMSAACRMPRTTVRDYCQRAKAAGVFPSRCVRRDFDPCLIATFNMDAVIPVLIFTAVKRHPDLRDTATPTFTKDGASGRAG